VVAADPTKGIDKPPVSKTVTSSRVLDNDDIVRFWYGCHSLGWPFGPLFQLLLRTRPAAQLLRCPPIS
jgi:hypothetical protein